MNLEEIGVTYTIFQKLGNPIDWDPVIYRVTVGVLGSVAIIVVMAQAVLAYCVKGANIPEGLVAIGAAAIGALAGLLAPTSGSKQG